MPAQMVRVTTSDGTQRALNGGVRRRRRSRGGRGRRRRRVDPPASSPATKGEVVHLRDLVIGLERRFDSFAEELEEQRRRQQRAERFGAPLGQKISTIAASQAEMMRLLQDIAGGPSRVAAFSPDAPGDDGSSSSSSS